MRNLLIIALAGLIKHGSALDLNAFPTNIQEKLGEHGIGNSDTKLSVTLVWYAVELWNVDTDLDLHVFEPNGHEIYYGNRGPLPSTGQFFVDTGKPTATSMGLVGVEHIAWTSAQSGQYRVAVKNYNKGNMDTYQPVRSKEWSHRYVHTVCTQHR